MKQQSPRLLHAYQDGLRRCLKEAPDYNFDEAQKLGEKALGLRMEALDLAKLHEEALVALILDPSPHCNRDDTIRVARAFFAIAVTPIEAGHRATSEPNVELQSTLEQLSQRTLELDASNTALKAETECREHVEFLLRTSESASSKLLAESLHLQDQLRHLSRRLLVAQEDERRRISRELHDVVAQTLTGINVRLATLTLQTDANSEGIHRKIISTQRLVEKSLDIVHRFARDLRPSVLDDLGLIPALQSYLKDFMEGSGIRARLAVFAGVEKLSNEVRSGLYRIAQKALTNVAQHSKATNATVSIKRLKNLVRMEIHDDGEGFEVAKPIRLPTGQGLGLLAMREQVEMINGIFRVDSVPGKETTIRVDIPREPADHSISNQRETLTIPLK